MMDEPDSDYPPPPPRRSLSDVLGLLSAMALVGSGFVVMLWIGFTWHDDPMPPPIGELFAPALLVFVASLAWWGWRLPRMTLGRGRARRQAQRHYRDWKVERAHRIAELRADPALHTYADRMEAGENWSDDQIAYDLDPQAVATCEHLAAVEQAMRAAGILVKLQTARVLHAGCTVEEAALRARFALEPPAWYGLIPTWDRSAEDPPSAAFRCEAHGAVIWVTEPGSATPETPRFP